MILIFASCEVDKPQTLKANSDVELLKLGLHDLIETGETDKIEVIDFEINSLSENERSLNPYSLRLSYVGNAIGPEDCCELTILGFDQCDTSKDFIIWLQEVGFETNYPNEWNRWFVDKIDVSGNLIENILTHDFPNFSYFVDDFPCDTTDPYGTALVYPYDGVIVPGQFRIRVERWHTNASGTNIKDCETDYFYANYGSPGC